MVLARCNLFPRALLPLRLFEPRYLTMLDDVLRSHRMFCIGTLLPGTDEASPECDEHIAPHSTAGLVRACVRGEDGVARLMLQGVQRVRILSWERREPYRLARVEPVFSSDPDPDRSRTLAESVLESVMGILRPDSALGRQISRQLRDLNNPELLADFVAANFLTDPLKRQPLLGMESVTDRLRYLRSLLPENRKTGSGGEE